MRAVITGASKGIGKAIADLFMEEGIDIAINSRHIDELEAIKAAYAKSHPDREVLIKATDMSQKQEVIDFGEYVKSKWNQVDILINNAGVFLPGEIHKEADEVLEKQMDTNLYSAYHMTRSLLPVMLPQKKGIIFNMCSVASLMAYPHGGSYSISKFALLGFSKVLREEMKDKGIKVVSIMPGATWSNSWAGVEQPEERLMQAHDIALVVMSAIKLSPSAVMEEIILRPQLGDL